MSGDHWTWLSSGCVVWVGGEALWSNEERGTPREGYLNDGFFGTRVLRYFNPHLLSTKALSYFPFFWAEVESIGGVERLGPSHNRVNSLGGRRAPELLLHIQVTVCTVSANR